MYMDEQKELPTEGNVAAESSTANSILIKGMLVTALIGLMLIPGLFVSNLVTERKARQQDVVGEVGNKWAYHQTVTGPLLMLPFKSLQTNSDGQVIERIKMAYVLPNELKIDGRIDPIVKKRTLYNVNLYRSTLKLEGHFDRAAFDKLKIPPEDIMWQDARLVLHVDDMRGITDNVMLQWNSTKMPMEAEMLDNDLFSKGICAPITIADGAPMSFNIDLHLKGSEYLYFTPVGKNTAVTLESPWKNPAFDGQYLPETSAVKDGQFKANWKIPTLSHTYTQAWVGSNQKLDKAAFGVRLINTVDTYTKTERSVKYAILFVALTFTFFFFLEILLKKQIHAIQYILVGIALTVFYTLLLSISEYLGFNWAYLMASIATISLIGTYVWGIFKQGKTAAGFIATLTGLYVYIFVLIQSEDYSLLIGSIGLFVILAMLMFYSRKIDWYGATKATA